MSNTKQDAVSVFADFLGCPTEKIQFLFDTYQTIGSMELELKVSQADRENERFLQKTLQELEGLFRTLASTDRGWLTIEESLECHVYLRNKIENKAAYQRMKTGQALEKALRDKTGKGRGRTILNWAQEGDIAQKTLIYGLVSYAEYYRDRQCFSEISDVLQATDVLPDSSYEEIRRRYDNVIKSLSHRIFVHNCLREASQSTKTLIVDGEPLVTVTYSLPIWEALASPQTDPLFTMIRKSWAADFSIIIS
ncbi:hypothetical protein [Syntrophorhabdus aromaticivorans]|uniref:hypothetical protein n=1 Tax=Syntrophorhabdus aromaticivorans TaxID=328301 RepID=UPI000420EFBE|nr:hypothetical protein [Syntrophorhabdus aromaticivorans]